MGPFIYYVRAVYKLCRLKGGGVKNCQYYLVKRRLRGEMGSKLPILGRYSLRTAPKHLFIYVLVRWCISRTEIKYSRIFLWSTFYHGKKWQKYSKKRVFHFFYWKFGFYLCYDILGVVLSKGTYINDVRRFSTIFDPPPLPLNVRFLPSNVRFFGVILDPHPLPPYNRTSFMHVP